MSGKAILASVLFALGGASLYGAWLQVGMAADRDADFVTEGTVVAFDETLDLEDDITLYWAQVEYRDEAGAVRRFRDSVGSSSPSFEMGEKVDVAYDPAAPAAAYIPRLAFEVVPLVVLSLFGLGLLVGFGFTVRSAVRDLRSGEADDFGRVGRVAGVVALALGAGVALWLAQSAGALAMAAWILVTVGCVFAGSIAMVLNDSPAPGRSSKASLVVLFGLAQGIGFTTRAVVGDAPIVTARAYVEARAPGWRDSLGGATPDTEAGMQVHYPQDADAPAVLRSGVRYGFEGGRFVATFVQSELGVDLVHIFDLETGEWEQRQSTAVGAGALD